MGMNRVAKRAVVIATAIWYIICGAQCARADKDASGAYEYCMTIRDDNYEGGDLWCEMNAIMDSCFVVTDNDTICKDWDRYEALMNGASYEHYLYE